jgi:hypothetical protein
MQSYFRTFGYAPLIGIIATAVSMAPTGVGVLCWLIGMGAFHYGIYSAKEIK